MEYSHISVLLNECIEGLKINPKGVYVDGTLGGAGHSYYIAKKLSKEGLLIGIDRDLEAIRASKERLKEFDNVKYVNDNHDNIKNILSNLNIEKADGILLDLGVSSYQIDEQSRGFSYIIDGKLDMRMDQTQELTAEKVVNTYKEEELARIIYEYGEEKFSRRIAKNICEYRKNNIIDTTGKLADIIEKSVPNFSKNNRRASSQKNFSSNKNRSK